MDFDMYCKFIYFLFVVIFAFPMHFLSGSAFEQQKEIFELGIKNFQNHPQQIKDFTFKYLEASENWQKANETHNTLILLKQMVLEKTDFTNKESLLKIKSEIERNNCLKWYLGNIISLNYIGKKCRDLNNNIFLTLEYCANLLTIFQIEDPKNNEKEDVKSNEYLKKITEAKISLNYLKTTSTCSFDYFFDCFFDMNELVFDYSMQNRYFSSLFDSKESLFAKYNLNFKPFVFTGDNAVIDEKMFPYALSKGYVLLGLNHKLECVHGGTYQFAKEVMAHDAEHIDFLLKKGQKNSSKIKNYIIDYAKFIQKAQDERFNEQEIEIAGYAAYYATHEQFLFEFVEKFLPEEIENKDTLYFKEFFNQLISHNKVHHERYLKQKDDYTNLRIISYYDNAKSIVKLIPSLKKKVFKKKKISYIYVPYNHKFVFKFHEKLLEWFFARINGEHKKSFKY